MTGSIQSYAGTGDFVPYALQGVVQVGASLGVSYSGCTTKAANPGFNPYSTPDNYSDTLTAVVNF